MRRTALRPAECARALWLLGLEPPVERDELARAWKLRVARTHPDLHAQSERRSEAATVLTTAINQARDTVSAWIDSGREWPAPSGKPKAPKRRRQQPAEATICRHTGLRAGDLVRVRPYDMEPLTVRGTELEAGAGVVWVLLADGSAAPAAHVRLAAFGCPVCGACEGPVNGNVVTRPCGDCLRDLRRLEQRATEAPRIRSAIEARSEGGRATARVLDSEWLEHRAHERCRWARRLRTAGDDDLRAALLGAFTRAFEQWAA
ncbi:MAG: hypothetical protein QOJ13_2734 [Gaiellales bacterium]|jgi:hypothetical protein|nr:hypothetical protein [Gaiellales bacterium]